MRRVLPDRETTTAVIPAHTVRLDDGSLLRAVASVLDQERPADAIAIAVDATGQGAAATRQRALDMALTDFAAFLDSDDLWHPNHLRVLHALADANDADYVHSWFDGNAPFPEHSHRGQPMNPLAVHHTTMTVMVRTDLARDVGFRPYPGAVGESAEDWLFQLGCIERGAVFASSPEVTWHYGVDGGNTSGMPSRWTPSRPQADVSVIIPHIPTRRAELLRALGSVTAQTLLPAAILIAVDHDHAGSAWTRNRALYAAHSTWCAPLDDDDELEPQHLAELVACAEKTDADVVYSGCTPIGPNGEALPLREEWGRSGRPFDGDLLRQRPYLPVTSLIRTELAHAVGGYRFAPDSPYDDYQLYLALLDAGAKFVHLPTVTWRWHMPGRGAPGVPGNTSGNPANW